MRHSSRNCGAQAAVEVDGGLVPVEHVPLQPRAAFLRRRWRRRGQQERFADALPAKCGEHEEVFEMDAGRPSQVE